LRNNILGSITIAIDAVVIDIRLFLLCHIIIRLIFHNL
jgi:hypothetical protein